MIIMNMDKISVESKPINNEKKEDSVSKKIRNKILIFTTVLASLLVAKESNAQYTHPELSLNNVPSELFAEPGTLNNFKNVTFEKVDQSSLKTIHDKVNQIFKDETYRFDGVAEDDNGGKYVTTEHIKATLANGILLLDEFKIVEHQDFFEVIGQLDIMNSRGHQSSNEQFNEAEKSLESQGGLKSRDVYIKIDKKTGTVLEFVNATPSGQVMGSPSPEIAQVVAETQRMGMEWLVVTKDGKTEQLNYKKDMVKGIISTVASSTPKENSPEAQRILKAQENMK